jgi:3-oxoacyl-[acyl-carrier protein] reductase
MTGPATLPLAGRTALVTGAGRGIGRAYALRLAALGADVAVLDRDLRSYEDFELERQAMRAATTAEEVEMLGRRSLALEVDVTDHAAVDAAVGDVLAAWGHLDVAVCNAGGGAGTMEQTRASNVSQEFLDVTVRGNLYGTIHTCRAAAAPMKEQRWGRIVTISSQAGRRAYPDGGYSVYGAAKAGIAMYTRYLAQELGPYGVTANCLAPGYIATGRLMPLFSSLGAEELLDSIALRRYGTPEDCAGPLEFLVTDLGSYVTGTVIPVDGGSTR